MQIPVKMYVKIVQAVIGITAELGMAAVVMMEFQIIGVIM